MVPTEVLDEALRGGEGARLLASRAEKRFQNADRALRDALSQAPKYVVESKKKVHVLSEASCALSTELDMLSESLDDVTVTSQSIVEASRENKRKAALLDELAAALPPFVTVAEALHLSDGIEEKNFFELQSTLDVLHNATKVALSSQRPLLLRVAEDLEERAAEATAMMTARYMDLFQVKSNSISARILENSSASNALERVEAASDALARAGLLPDAIKGIVAEVMRNDVASGLRAATFFFEAESPEGASVEWTIGDTNSAELLEFDVDDLEGASDADIDAMSESLDIANAAARALKVFDLFRAKVIGAKHAALLATALQPWFAENVLPPSGVVSSVRKLYQTTGVPREALRVRALATTASANVLEHALRVRGAKDFKLGLDVEALERTVGAECRAEAVLAARKAIATFADADHDSAQIVSCPISSLAFVPRERRSGDYFPACLISQSAETVLAVFKATRADAREALAGGSYSIANSLNGAAIELSRAYLQDVPLQHGEELRSSLRLKALYYNDCMALAHVCRLSASSEGATTGGEFIPMATNLERAAQGAMMNVRKTAEQRLDDNLNAACRNGALGAYGTLTRLQRVAALAAAVDTMDEVVSVLADIVPTELAELAAATLCDKYLGRLCFEVAALPEISAEGCEQIDKILADADKNVNRLMQRVNGMESVRNGAPTPKPVERLRVTRRKVTAYREVLNGRMEDITTSFREGKYDGLIDRTTMEHFLKAIFEDTPLRASFIQDLDISVEAESGEWSNSNW